MRYDSIYIYLCLTLALSSLPALTSCSTHDEPDTRDDTQTDAVSIIRISAAIVPGRWDKVLPGEDPFTVLLWEDYNVSQLETSGTTGWTAPYVASESQKPVSSWEEFVYDVGVPYPAIANETLYATGFSPTKELVPSDNYRVLNYGDSSESDAKLREPCRIDFLGCDLWRDVYRGSLADHFAQDKNRLYFRHLASKLVFYADREAVSMEGRQYVRNVKITNLRMRVNGGEWGPLYAPVRFTWGPLNSEIHFSTAYNELVENVKKIPGNTDVTTVPSFGYKTSLARPFASNLTDADGNRYEFLRRLADGSPATDRVPVAGMPLDSCYVVSPLDDDNLPIRGRIELCMDITAELSYDFPFSLPDGVEPDGTNTDDMTFTSTWSNVTVDQIKVIDADGNPIQKNENEFEYVDLFKPGHEYRIYIHFSRTGVNIVARQMPWNYGGIHYVAFIGGDTQPQQPEGGDTPPASVRKAHSLNNER